MLIDKHVLNRNINIVRMGYLKQIAAHHRRVIEREQGKLKKVEASMAELGAELGRY